MAGGCGTLGAISGAAGLDRAIQESKRDLETQPATKHRVLKVNTKEKHIWMVRWKGWPAVLSPADASCSSFLSRIRSTAEQSVAEFCGWLQ